MSEESRLLAWARKQQLTAQQANALVVRARKLASQRVRRGADAQSFIPCCGQWFPVRVLPQVVPCCGKLWRIALKRSSLERQGMLAAVLHSITQASTFSRHTTLPQQLSVHS